jgi:hypothetical protein
MSEKVSLQSKRLAAQPSFYTIMVEGIKTDLKDRDILFKHFE